MKVIKHTIWKILTINLVFALLLLLNGCSIVNVQKYSTMYGDAITVKNVGTYSKYYDLSVSKMNDYFNKLLYETLVDSLIYQNGENTLVDYDLLEETVEDFRKDEIMFFVVKADEDKGIATVKVSVSNVFSIFLKSINNDVQNGTEDFNLSHAVLDAFEKGEVVDTVTIDLSIEKPKTTGKYELTEDSEKELIELLLGVGNY